MLEDDAEIMSDAQLVELLADEPPEVQDEILRINDDVRARALQVALLVPLVAGLLGVVAALRMRRIPDPEVREDAPRPSADVRRPAPQVGSLRTVRDRTETPSSLALTAAKLPGNSDL